MSRVCQVSGKKAQVGNNVSHAHNKTKRVRKVNLITKRLFDSSKGKWVKVRISARALKKINKTGFSSDMIKY